MILYFFSKSSTSFGSSGGRVRAVCDAISRVWGIVNIYALEQALAVELIIFKELVSLFKTILCFLSEQSIGLGTERGGEVWTYSMIANECLLTYFMFFKERANGILSLCLQNGVHFFTELSFMRHQIDWV